MEKARKRDNININDRQMACTKIYFQEGQDYLKGMVAAANYAWVNRSSMTFLKTGTVISLLCAEYQFLLISIIVQWNNQWNQMFIQVRNEAKMLLEEPKFPWNFFETVCFKHLWKMMLVHKY